MGNTLLPTKSHKLVIASTTVASLERTGAIIKTRMNYATVTSCLMTG
jgi:hypothetical protein